MKHDDTQARRRRPFDYGTLRVLVLAMIQERPRHGYDLIKAIEAHSGGRYIPSPGVIYPTLSWLEDLGYVVAQPEAGRRSHSITPEGQAFLRANHATLSALMARDWMLEEDENDPIHAGMQAIKLALRACLKHGEPEPAQRDAIAEALQGAARTIRIQSGSPAVIARATRQNDAQPDPTGDHMEQIITRHRFDIRRRSLTVLEKTHITPRMIRMVLTGADLEDFQSLAPDDHIKLFFETGGEKPEMRDYTPRAFDAQAQRLTLDFAVHEAGPATRWAIDAAVGDTLNIAGPRGSAVVTADCDWWLLIADETALPAMGRWVEELPAGSRVTTLGLVSGPAEEQVFATAATHVAHWAHRADPADPAPVLEAVSGLTLPAGRGFIWVAAEAGVARAVRDYLRDVRQHPREWLKAAGYWVKGQADATDKMMD
ncbi:MAG TPA: SIP domain-containing protein [Paenirhodobacter sp.]